MRRAVTIAWCATLIITGISPVAASTLPGADSSIQDQPQIKFKVNEDFHPRVALALGGGGVRGAAHIGAMKVLQDAGIPIDYVVGNSMGAVVGGLYCAGVPLNEIQSILSDGSLISAYLPRFLWLRIILRPIGNLFRLDKENLYAGLVDGAKLKVIIDRLLPDSNIKVESLKTPFAAIAVSLVDGNTHVLSSGRIDDIVRASATIPMLLRPVPIADQLYVDGGVRNNLPTNEARHSGAKIVISVDIDTDMKPVPAKEFRSFHTVFDRVVNAALEQQDEDNVHGADVVIRPQLVNIPVLSKDKQYVNDAVRQGELAARQSLPRILELLKHADIATVDATARTERRISKGSGLPECR